MSSFHMLMDKFNIIHAPLLFEGTMTECLNYPNDGKSVLYKSYNLPELKDNIMEGVVIKPIETLYIGETRVILKNKNAKHSEKDKVKKIKKPVEFSEEETVVLEQLISYLNDNRIRSAISKLGEVTQKDFGKLLGMIKGDCIKDLIKDNENFVEFEEKSRDKIIRQFTKEFLAPTIRENFLNIIDATF